MSGRFDLWLPGVLRYIEIVDGDDFLAVRRASYHSRHFWLGLLASALLIAAGTAWLFGGLNRIVGITTVGAGALAGGRWLVDRWAVDHGHETSHDWRPRRRVYLVPVGLLVGGVLLASLVPGHTNPLIRIGILMLSVSIPMAISIAVRRAMNNTDGETT